MEEREFMKERMKELRGQLKDFILDQRDKKREIARLASRVAELEAALKERNSLLTEIEEETNCSHTMHAVHEARLRWNALAAKSDATPPGE